MVLGSADRPGKVAAKIPVLMAKTPKLKIQYIPIERVVFDPNNARTHSDFQLGQIADSIRAFGMTNPVGVFSLPNGDWQLIFGEGRVQGAKLAGLSEVPAVMLDHLSERERRAYALADNKIAQNSGWDFSRISKEVDFLLEQDFDLGFTGFNSAEIDAILRNDVGLLPNDGYLEKDIFVRPHFREGAGESEKPTKPKKEVFSVSVTFKNEAQRDDFLDEMKKRKLRAVILK